MLDDVAAEVKNGQIQQPFLDEEQAVEHAPGAAIAIVKGVDRLERVMPDGHADQRVEIGGVVHEAFPVGEQVADDCFARWRV